MSDKISTIDSFRSKLDQYGSIIQENKFLFMITPPAGLQLLSIYSEIGKDLAFLCPRVQSPNITLQTREYFEQGYGLADLTPVGIRIDPIVAQFYNDGQSEALAFFESWFRLITTTDQSLNPYEINYPSSYRTQAQLYVYNNSAQKIITFQFNSIYPIARPHINLDWNSNNLMSFTIQFKFKSYTVSGTVPGSTITQMLNNT